MRAAFPTSDKFEVNNCYICDFYVRSLAFLIRLLFSISCALWSNLHRIRCTNVDQTMTSDHRLAITNPKTASKFWVFDWWLLSNYLAMYLSHLYSCSLLLNKHTMVIVIKQAFKHVWLYDISGTDWEFCMLLSSKHYKFPWSLTYIWLPLHIHILKLQPLIYDLHAICIWKYLP